MKTKIFEDIVLDLISCKALEDNGIMIDSVMVWCAPTKGPDFSAEVTYVDFASNKAARPKEDVTVCAAFTYLELLTWAKKKVSEVSPRTYPSIKALAEFCKTLSPAVLA